MANSEWSKIADYTPPDSTRYPEVVMIWPSPLGDVGLGYYDLLDHCWCWAEQGGGREKIKCLPSHWRPLPAPPNEEG